jgi:UDP:flavonoid glycosyltransferase YjiC (YdhE family)
MLASITAGIPSVAVPIFADHPINSMKIAAAGAGIALAAGEQTPAAIRAAVDRILADDLYRRNAARVRDELLAMPGLEHGVALLETLATTKRPIPRGSFTPKTTEPRT